jgi:hypothetical protein
MERIIRHSIAVFLLAMVLGPADASAQPAATEPKDQPSSIVVIDAPPQAPPPQQPSTGVILRRPGPGRVTLSGTPVPVHLQSPTDGVAFQLRTGGSYSAISGVSFGVGYGWGGAGWGWGGYGVGYGVAPYYGEVITKAYQPICEAPCDATLLSGRHRFALSLDGGRPVDIAQPIDLSVESVVEGRYVDKSHLRRAGWITFVAGSVAGMALMFASIDYRGDPYFGDQLRYGGMFYTGVGLFVSSIITGAVLAAQNDEASVTVYPVE